MKVDVVFRVSCARAQSLHYRDEGLAEDIVQETFMISVRCGSYSYVSQLQSQLGAVYPFIAVDSIADLDITVAEAYDTVATVWENYQNYGEDERGDEEGAEHGDLEEQNVSVVAVARFTGTTHGEVCQFHDVLQQHPVSAELRKALKDTSTDALDINSYFIRFPSGRSHRFDGHSYDSLEGCDTLVDQLLTSTEKYVVTDAEGGESVELSTQQCVVVDAYDQDSCYKPYIMVNKSGLRQLERFGPIGTLKIRIHGEEAESARPTPSPAAGTNRPPNTYQAVFEAYSDALGLFQAMRSDGGDRVSASERVLMDEVVRELVPLLDSIRTAMPEPQEPQPPLLRRAYRSSISLARRFAFNWLFSGLLLNVGFVLSQYLLMCLFWGLILPTLGLPRNYIAVAVFAANLFSENMLTMLERTGREGGIGACLRVHAWMRLLKAAAASHVDTLYHAVVLFCVSYQRPVYSPDGSLDPASEADEARRRAQSLLRRLGLLLLRTVQDLLLFVLTLEPNFAEVYQRVLREVQTQTPNQARVQHED